MRSVIDYINLTEGSNQTPQIISKIIPLELNVSGVKIKIKNQIILLSFYNSLLKKETEFKNLFTHIPTIYDMTQTKQVKTIITNFAKKEMSKDYVKNAIWEIFNIHILATDTFSFDAYYRKKGVKENQLGHIIKVEISPNTGDLSINLDVEASGIFPESV